MAQQHDEVGVRQDVEALFLERDARGKLRFGEVEAKAVLAFVLLEIARRQELAVLSPQGKAELGNLFDQIGLTEETPPEQVKPLLQEFFKRLGANPAIFVKVDRILKRRTKASDRLEAADASSALYQKIASRDALTAPNVEDEAPEGSKPAQSLAQSLGVKVRI